MGLETVDFKAVMVPLNRKHNPYDSIIFQQKKAAPVWRRLHPLSILNNHWVLWFVTYNHSIRWISL